MHREQVSFLMRCKAIFPRYFKSCSVVEIGSYNANGGIRWLFKSCDYIGLDIHAGKGVDVVLRPGYILHGDADVVLCCEVLEHDFLWQHTVKNAAAIARKCLIITCATTGRAEHGTRKTTPWASPATTDYYENRTIEDLEPLLKDFPYKKFWINEQSHDLYFLGFKEKPLFRPSKLKYLLFEIKAFWLIDRPRDIKMFLRKIVGKSR